MRAARRIYIYPSRVARHVSTSWKPRPRNLIFVLFYNKAFRHHYKFTRQVTWRSEPAARHDTQSKQQITNRQQTTIDRQRTTNNRQTNKNNQTDKQTDGQDRQTDNNNNKRTNKDDDKQTRTENENPATPHTLPIAEAWRGKQKCNALASHQDFWCFFSTSGRFVTSPGLLVRCRDDRNQQRGTTPKQTTNNEKPTNETTNKTATERTTNETTGTIRQTNLNRQREPCNAAPPYNRNLESKSHDDTIRPALLLHVSHTLYIYIHFTFTWIDFASSQ